MNANMTADKPPFVSLMEWDRATTEQRQKWIDEKRYLSPEDGKILGDRIFGRAK